MVKVSVDELGSVIQRIVEGAGTPPDSAATVTRLLVGSHLAGHDSHGVQHLPRYIEELQRGEIVPTARPAVVKETASTALVRGNWGWGHVTADFVTRLAIRKATDTGLALVSAVEVNHIGRLGDYVELAAQQGVIGILASGGNAEEYATAAPYGGAKAVLAPNPLAIGFPSERDHPVVVDFATTIVAGGKVALAKAKGAPVPLGWIIDKRGHPSTDPNAYYDSGALLPFGEHKGFGIMVAMEILGRILSGADAYSETPHGGTYFRHCGISFIALRAGVYSSGEAFAARTTELATRIRAVPPAPGYPAVMLPGDYEYRARSERSRSGIEIPEETWAEVRATATHLGVEL